MAILLNRVKSVGLLKHELIPVPVSLAEVNCTLLTGNNLELAHVVPEDN